jgi:AmmeMemoRadiSam system protein B
MIREPAVAGRFYQNNGNVLRREVEGFLSFDGQKEPYTGCVVPHAGYMFSGETAGMVLSCIDMPDTAILFSPNHTGAGKSISVWSGDGWRTPLGTAGIDEEIRERIYSIDGAERDTEAHRMEHSIEVIVPFLQVMNENISIVPVTAACRDREKLISFGRSVAETVSGAGKDILLIASSDMTHMEPAEQARAKDMKCIEKMEQVDPGGLYELVTKEGISMCGVFPVTILLSACRKMGVSEGKLVNYTNSGETTGDIMNVVGYAVMLF